MANSVEIIFQGVDKVSGVVNKITSANNSNAKSLLAMVGGWAAVGTAAYKAADYIADSVQSTVDYGKAVRDMARITGDSVEETSRLIQVSDDLVISQEELAAAMRGAVQKGVDTSIDGMARLADEYLKLDKGLERSEFLVDNFGRTGLKMGAMMEKGGEGIRAMADSIDDSLIMTQEAVDAAREYEIAVDDLNDAFEGLKVKIGNEVIPILTDVINIWTDPSIRSEGFNRMFGETTPVVKELSDALADNTEAWENQRTHLTTSKQAVVEIVNEYTALDEAIDKQRGGMVDLSIALSNSITAYRTEAEELRNTTASTAEYEAAIWKLSEATRQQRQEMLLNIVTQGMDEESKYAVYNAMGLINDETYSLIQSILDQKQAFSDEKIEADELAEKLRDVLNRMNDLDGKAVTMSVNTEWNNPIFDAPSPYGPGLASGGAFTVPPGYPNDSYGMRVSSGEHVQVTPAGEKTYGGNTIILNYSPVVSLADRYEAETKLVPYIESALRKIR